MSPIMHFGQISCGGCVCLQAGNTANGTGGETSRELSLSRELSTNEIALFSIVFYINAQFLAQTFAFDGKYKSKKNIYINTVLY